ncbi:NLR family CARD domain-containing protein 3-like isoform X2 [Scleropages formosus]|uniref:NLR family CARD domain-containing protein 3-like n=1 Tax=Scleropages formosus TaxID=113540 RepID=A0A8C9TTN5_SCLFO|nr:NLR family CARD domain-containing protein 3-like isoform X2 [Scleropages formosus]
MAVKRRRSSTSNRMDAITKHIPRKVKRVPRNKENVSPSHTKTCSKNHESPVQRKRPSDSVSPIPTKKHRENQGSPVFRKRSRDYVGPHHISKTPEQRSPLPLNVIAKSGAKALAPLFNSSTIRGSVNTIFNYSDSNNSGTGIQTGELGRQPPDSPAQHQNACKEEDTKLQEAQEKNKSNLKKKNESIFEGIARPGKSVLLKSVYTNLCFTEGDSGGVNDEHEVWQNKGTSRREVSQHMCVCIDDIFKPLPGQEKSIRTVLTKGIAGIGKTVSVQKFVLNWVEGKANQDVVFIFQFAFQELNAVCQNELSLKKLIYSFYPETKHLNVKAYKVLFIFDGLDEYRYPLKFLSKRCASITEIAPLDVLLSNLIEGNLFPSALLWITSRPAAACHIPPKFINQVTEIRGFNDPQKEEYFRKKFPDQHLASRIISHVQSSRSLHIMCHIPIFSWISAAVLGQMLTKDDQEIPSTLTQIYSQFLLIQINLMNNKHQSDTERNVTKLQRRDKEILMKLAEFAFKQLEKGSVMFHKEDLKACGSGNVAGSSVYSVLCTEVIEEEIALIQERFGCFVHLSIQEFLAALYTLHLFTSIKMNLLKEFFKKNPRTLHGLQKAAINKALEHKNGQFDLFLRFLLGMSLDINQSLLKDLLPWTGRTSESIKKTKLHINNLLKKKGLSPDRGINLIHCLVELNDCSLLAEIQKGESTGPKKQIRIALCSALAYMLMSDTVLDEFDPKKYKTSQEGFRRLIPVIKHSRRARLDHCGLSADCCETVSFALQSANSHLTELNLSHNDLGDLGLEKLCVGLKSPNCKLESLDLSFNKLNASGMKLLSDVLIGPHCKLQSLDLSNNDLEDSGVNVLCQALSNHQCKLKTLRLSKCRVTEGGCTSLASALQLNPLYLNELDICNNHPGDSGVRTFIDVLRNSDLEYLKIGCVGDHKIELNKYTRELTVDLDRANKNLYINKKHRRLSKRNEEYKNIMNQRKRKTDSSPEHKESFHHRNKVLCKEGVN